MPTVQQKNLKDTVTMPTCRNSHKGISARNRSEKTFSRYPPDSPEYSSGS
ncbi:hypothetical protein [Rhizobium redzepovicii]